eukprot:jgi/Picsp_1/2495/NSC_00726-R1_protein
MVWGQPQGIDDIVARLSRNDLSMSSLYLMRNRRFNEGDIAKLADVLGRNTNLVELDLSSHPISSSMAANLASGLQTNTSLQRISIGDSTFGDEACIELCNGLAGNVSIHILDMEKKGITGKSCAYLGDALKKNSSIRHIILSGNELGGDAMSYFAESFKYMERIELNYCGIGCDLSSKSVMDFLSVCSGLSHLEIHGNNIDSSSIGILGPGLGNCLALKTLSINSNPLSHTGVGTLISSLPSSIEILDISDTNAGPGGIMSLSKQIRDGRFLKLNCIKVCHCHVDGHILVHLIAALDSVHPKESDAVDIDISGNDVISGASELAKSFLVSKRLRNIHMHGCNAKAAIEEFVLGITSKGSEEVLPLLQDLDISANFIPVNTMMRFLECLAINQSIMRSLNTLVIGANPGVEGDEIIGCMEKLQIARPSLMIRAAAIGLGETTPKGQM